MIFVSKFLFFFDQNLDFVLGKPGGAGSMSPAQKFRERTGRGFEQFGDLIDNMDPTKGDWSPTRNYDNVANSPSRGKLRRSASKDYQRDIKYPG